MNDTTGKTIPKGRQVLLKGTILIIGVIVGLLLVEITLRLITTREVMRYFFMSPDSIVHHRFTPNSSGRYQTVEFDTYYHINSLGLRDREYSTRKPDTSVRILMLGDSFTEGDGVEASETFSKVLEVLLDSAGGTKKCEIINAGVGSYSPVLEYLYVKKHGLSLSPDLVVLNFDLSDVFDDIQYSRLARFDDTGNVLGVSPASENRNESLIIRVLAGIKDFFKEHTRTYNFVRIRIDRYLEGVRHEGDFSGDVRYDKYAMLRENQQAKDGGDWSQSFKYILQLRDLLRAHHIDFLLTVYPYGLQVSPKEWNLGRQFWGFKSDTVYACLPQSKMEDFCRRNGIKVINMCDAFKLASQATHPLFLEYNGHWTPAGHRVVAEALKPEITSYLRSRLFK